MNYLTEAEIDQLIHEDLPFIDITCHSIKVGSKVARISFITRQNTVICGTEIILKFFEKFNITPTLISFSGEQIEPGIKFLEGEGLATNLHAISRSATNLLEFCSGIATRTKALVSAASEISPCIPIQLSAKGIPFTKKLTIKSVHIGGGCVQNLGPAGALLITDRHIKFLGGMEGLIKKITEIKNKTPGNQIAVEITNTGDALTLAKSAIDTLQIDQISFNELVKLIPEIKKMNPGLKLAVSGDINDSNIADYLKLPVNALISTWIYHGKPADFLVHIEPVFELY